MSNSITTRPNLKVKTRRCFISCQYKYKEGSIAFVQCKNYISNILLYIFISFQTLLTQLHKSSVNQFNKHLACSLLFNFFWILVATNQHNYSKLKNPKRAEQPTQIATGISVIRHRELWAPLHLLLPNSRKNNNIKNRHPVD